MRPPATLGVFALGLGLVFAGAYGVGNAVGPVGAVSEPVHSEPDDAGQHDMGFPRRDDVVGTATRLPLSPAPAQGL